jgi:hypothetical protein
MLLGSWDELDGSSPDGGSASGCWLVFFLDFFLLFRVFPFTLPPELS